MLEYLHNYFMLLFFSVREVKYYFYSSKLGKNEIQKRLISRRFCHYCPISELSGDESLVSLPTGVVLVPYPGFISSQEHGWSRRWAVFHGWVAEAGDVLVFTKPAGLCHVPAMNPALAAQLLPCGTLGAISDPEASPLCSHDLQLSSLPCLTPSWRITGAWPGDEAGCSGWSLFHILLALHTENSQPCRAVILKHQNTHFDIWAQTLHK